MRTLSEEGDSPGVTPQAIAEPAALLEKRGAENFPVALRVLPRDIRRHLGAVYDVVRVIDDLGDRVSGDRKVLLENFREDLAVTWSGGVPRHGVLRDLAPTVRECALEREPFERLIEANVQDQVVAAYPTFADLAGYCELSANPVGRIVLQVFGRNSAEEATLSDKICTALQIVEHVQDISEDRAVGRIYLPREDMAHYGVCPADLDEAHAAPALRRLVAFEVDRAETMLRDGIPLLGMLRGWARLAVAGYAAGGLAAVDAVRRAEWDVLPGAPVPSRRDVLGHLLRLYGQSVVKGRS